jgi:hypothetical protein
MSLDQTGVTGRSHLEDLLANCTICLSWINKSGNEIKYEELKHPVKNEHSLRKKEKSI